MIKNRIHSLSGNERFEPIPAWPANFFIAQKSDDLV
jgi:hypothetical protein